MKAPPYGGEIRRSHKVCKICGRIALAFVYFNNNLPTRTIVLQFLFFVRVTFLNLRTEFDVIVQSCIVRVYMNASDCHFVSFLAPACMRDIVIPYIVFILFKSCKSFFVYVHVQSSRVWIPYYLSKVYNGEPMGWTAISRSLNVQEEMVSTN